MHGPTDKCVGGDAIKSPGSRLVAIASDRHPARDNATVSTELLLAGANLCITCTPADKCTPRGLLADDSWSELAAFNRPLLPGADRSKHQRGIGMNQQQGEHVWGKPISVNLIKRPGRTRGVNLRADCCGRSCGPRV